MKRYDQLLSEQEEILGSILSQGGTYEDLLALCDDRNQECLIEPPAYELGQSVRVIGTDYCFEILYIDRCDGQWIYCEDQDDSWFPEIRVRSL